jgi:hypothetical protein
MHCRHVCSSSERGGYEVIGSTRVGTRAWLRVKEVRHSRREWLLDPTATATATARSTKNAFMFRRCAESIGDVHDAHASPFVAATEEIDLGEKRYSRHPQEPEMLGHSQGRPCHRADFHIYLADPMQRRIYLSAFRSIWSWLSQRERLPPYNQSHKLLDSQASFPKQNWQLSRRWITGHSLLNYQSRCHYLERPQKRKIKGRR